MDRVFQGYVFLVAIIPNAISLFISESIPLLTFQRMGFVLLVAALFINNFGTRQKKIHRPPGFFWLCCFVLTLFLSILSSEIPSISVKEFFSERVLGLPFVFLLGYSMIRTRADAVRVFRLFALGSVIVILIVEYEYVTGTSFFGAFNLIPVGAQEMHDLRTELERRLGFFRVRAPFFHPLALGVYLSSIVSIALPFYAHAKRRGERVFWMVLIGLCSFGILATVSRGPVIVLCILLVLSFRNSKLFLLFGVALFYLVFQFLAEREFIIEGSSLVRVSTIEDILNRLVSIPVTGIGLNVFTQFASTGSSLITTLLDYIDPMAYLLVVLIEAGIVSLVVFLLFITKTLRIIRSGFGNLFSRQASLEEELLRYGFLDIALNTLAAFFTVTIFNGSQLLLMHVFLLTAMLRLVNIRRESQVTHVCKP